MPSVRSRMAREARTVEAMISLYCRQRHVRQRHVRERHSSGGALCSACGELLDYARARLDRCPYQEGKITCARCPVHCYRPERQEQIRAVMRYAGPRMLLRHPVMALLHLIDGLRKEPARPQCKGGHS